MLEILGVSKSGYYAWINRKPSNRSVIKAKVIETIKQIYDDSKCIYGAPKITVELHKLGFTTAESTVTKYMREMGIRACWVKPHTVTTHSEDFSSKLKNILKRNFSPEYPNAVWCTDITYIHTRKGFVYLSCIMDLFSRKIVSWELAPTLETKYVVAAVQKAINRSYSAKANPWDNACIESFHALIKREWLNRFDIQDINHAHKLVFEYIDAFYNTWRIHSFCGYQSPMSYENEYYLRHPIEKEVA